MIRTTTLAALSLALMSATAFAQTADAPNAPPAQLSGPNMGPPPGEDEQGPPPGAYAQAPPQDAQQHDLSCRRDAAARTGYVTPGQAASNAQTNGTVGGTLGGAALGAIIGSASGHAGAGAAIGAGAGLLAGTAVGSANAQAAASDVQRNYAAAYYACMGGQGPGNTAYGYGPPPPPGAYPPGAYPPGAYPPPPYYYGGYPYGPYPYPYYGPAVTFGFGFGGYHGWHGRWR
jgi:hypothetical protein